MNAIQDKTRWNLKMAIMQSRLKHYQLAQAIGKDATWISKVIGGYKTPSDIERAQIASILQSNAKDLFDAAA
jgi:hypothetical protein